jgi:hypothetical protein
MCVCSYLFCAANLYLIQLNPLVGPQGSPRIYSQSADCQNKAVRGGGGEGGILPGALVLWPERSCVEGGGGEQLIMTEQQLPLRGRGPFRG